MSWTNTSVICLAVSPLRFFFAVRGPANLAASSKVSSLVLFTITWISSGSRVCLSSDRSTASIVSASL